jgi:TolB-like protein/DNA-binding winged helix-turn-helix (wHTH) protein/Tfp pilus assembly protein PilF
MSEQIQGCYEFGPFRIDAAKRILLREGQPVPLKPKVFETLLVLVEKSGRDLDKDELMQSIWPDTTVEENNLTQNISAIRKALGERRDEHRYIVTIPGRGYRFVADVRRATVNGVAANVDVIEGQSEGVEANSSTMALPAAGTLPQVLTVPQTRPRRLRWLAAAALLSLMVIGLVVALPRFRRGSNTSSPVETNRSIGSIAVLPFKPLGAREGDEYIGQGMADALITRLSKSRRLTVRSTGAVLRYNSPAQDSLAAGRELGVDSVLDGKLQHEGDRVRVTVQLVRVRDGASLWAETFDEKFTDIFAMQDSISDQVVKALTLELSREERERMRKRYTENTEAYQAFLKGRFFLDRRTSKSIRKAKDFFQEAVDRDRNYALAYVGLADCYHRFAQFGISPAAEAIPQATAAATKALELDDSLAEAHATLGVINFRYLLDLPTAEREFKRALELDPHYATAHMWYALQLMALNRYAEADAKMRRALELEPLSVTINNAVADYYVQLRDYDRAIEQYRKTIEIDPSMLSAQLGIGRAYEQKGMYREALEQYREVQSKLEDKQMPVQAGYTYAVSGRKAEARKILNGMLEKAKHSTGNPYIIAVIYAGLGEKENAFKWLEESYAARILMPGSLRFDARLDTLRDDPRFKQITQRMNLPL